jgi:hypothetical protein
MRDKINIEEGIKSLERVLLMMNYDNKKTLSENRTYVLEQQTGVKLTFDGPYLRDTNQKLKLFGTDKHIINHRKFNDKNSTKVYYTVTNNTSQPVIITQSNVQEDYYLDKIGHTESPIKPGEKGRIDFTINPVPDCIGFRTGDEKPTNYNEDRGVINREVKVVTNVGTQTFRVNVKPDEKLSGKEIEYCTEKREGTHSVLQWGAAIFGFAGFAFPPLLLVSLGLELYDSYTYLMEGDDYMAGLGFALAVIPGLELLPKGVITKPLKVVRSEILNVLKSAGKWSDDLLKRMSPEASNLVKWISKNFDNIITKSKNKFTNTANVFRFIRDKTHVPKILHKVFTMLKKTGKFLGDVTVKGILPAGGIMWSWDKLYNWLYPKTNQELFDYLEEGKKSIDDWINDGTGDEISKIKTNDTNSNNTKNGNQKSNWVSSPDIEKVSSGKSFIYRGMSGESVKKIQELLNTKGYSIDVDSKFGKYTYQTVKEFQKNNELKDDGIVGSKTYKKLVE